MPNDKLQDLPPSNHKFWKGAKKFKDERQPHKQCEHYFEAKSGIEIKCKKCNIGFYKYNSNTYVKDGKLFVAGQKVF